MTLADGAPPQQTPSERRERRLDLLVPGLMGLAGVLVGALVTAGITYLGDRNHRISEQRTATRLIANEIQTDSQILWQVRTLHRVPGALPQTVEWEANKATLARYLTDLGAWNDVVTFYDDVLRIRPGLATKAAHPATYLLAGTDARHGSCAFEALEHSSLPTAVVAAPAVCPSLTTSK